MTMEIQQKKLMTLLTMVLERAKDVFACKTIGSTAKPIRDNTNHSWGGTQFQNCTLPNIDFVQKPYMVISKDR